MLKILDLDDALNTILRRPSIDDLAVTERMRQRTITAFGEDLHPEEAVHRILKDVRQRGDAALIEWTHRLDGVSLTAERIEVADTVIAEAYDRVDAEVVAAMERAAERIARFHSRQVAQTWMTIDMGGVLGQIIRPLDRVGVYIPAGSAPLPSSLLMTAIPARQAGVEEIVVCSPPRRGTLLPDPLVLVAADIADVDRVYAIGGAQAIGAMAYGTDSVPRVDKVCGPGNTYVVQAKKQVFGVVGIDSLPGPTETVVVADDGANPAWVAADMLAQAEHAGGTSILITPSRQLADAVNRCLDAQLARLPEPSRSDIMESLADRSGAVIAEDLLEAIALADDFAPEHLCLSVREPWAWVGKIRNAGGVFLGETSYEVLGDYCSGPSHVMPTGGTARFASALNVLDFLRVMNVIGLDEETARQIAPMAVRLAEAEGLHAHAAAAKMRHSIER
jgi:histidinol dehydrogenase